MTRADAIARYIVRRGWSHLVLLTAAMLFLFPFVWMVATSMKTDEEIAARNWWPQFPVFRDHSPCVRPPVSIERPTGVTDEQWGINLPALRAQAEAAINEALARRDEIPPQHRAALVNAATPVLLNRLIGRLSIAAWNNPRLSLERDVAEAAIDDRLARVEILELQVRTLDARIFNVCTGDAIARDWQVESGDARLVAN